MKGMEKGMDTSLKIKLSSKNLLLKIWTSVGLMIFTSLYTIVDSLFVSNYINTTALAGINIAFPLITLIDAFIFMMASGGVAWVSIKIGAGEKEKANHDFSLIVYFGLFITIFFVCLALPSLDSLVKFLGAKDPELFGYTKDYLLLILLLDPFFMLQIIFQQFLFVEGKGKFALILTLSSGLTNIFFDYLFIVVLNLGIQGAALGTGAGYCVSTLFAGIFFIRNKKGLHLTKPSRNFSVIRGTMSNGLSEMVTNLSTSLTTFYLNYLTLKYLGSAGVAAISIIFYCQFLFSSIFFGFSIGSAPLIGFGWGSQEYDYTKKLLKLCVKLVLIFSLTMFIIAFTGAEIITQFFCRPDNPVYGITTHGLRLFSLSFLFSGISIFASSAFTALGDGRRSAILSFVRVFVLTLFFLTVFPLLLGVDGIWLAIPAAEITMVAIDVFFLGQLAKRLNVLQQAK